MRGHRQLILVLLHREEIFSKGLYGKSDITVRSKNFYSHKISCFSSSRPSFPSL